MAKMKNQDNEMFDVNCQHKEKCIPQEMVIRNVRLAAAYVPYQKLCTMFPPVEGLKMGTIFPELFSPYQGKDKKYKPEHKG